MSTRDYPVKDRLHRMTSGLRLAIRELDDQYAAGIAAGISRHDLRPNRHQANALGRYRRQIGRRIHLYEHPIGTP